MIADKHPKISSDLSCPLTHQYPVIETNKSNVKLLRLKAGANVWVLDPSILKFPMSTRTGVQAAEILA